MRPDGVARSSGPGLHRLRDDPARVADIDVLLELHRAPVQAVGMPHEDGVGAPALQVVEQRPVPGTRLAGVGGQVVVAVVSHNRPAKPVGQLGALLALPVDTQAGALTVLAGAAVDHRNTIHRLKCPR